MEAVEKADSVMVGDRSVHVIDPDRLAAMWLMAGRKKDLDKIAVFLDNDLINRQEFLDIVERHGLALKWQKERYRFEDGA